VIAPPPSREPWTEARLRTALELYLRRKQHWHTEAQFVADGLTGLIGGIRRTGGVKRWSAEFAMPLRPRQRRPDKRPAFIGTERDAPRVAGDRLAT
jgi:hypothetical protein